jgi:rhodanese-related sulfurtransferase
MATAFFVTNPPALKTQSSVKDLKTRLDWGEPALTILDVRDRSAFNLEHIQGAISMPLATLVASAQQTLEQERDIYVYGDSEATTAEAANQLRASGYQQVAELIGGLADWKAAQFPVEGL